jgi:hypothetical protein
MLSFVVNQKPRKRRNTIMAKSQFDYGNQAAGAKGKDAYAEVNPKTGLPHHPVTDPKPMNAQQAEEAKEAAKR